MILLEHLRQTTIHASKPAPPSRGRYEYHAWRDSRLGRQRVERDGVETVIVLVPGEGPGLACGQADRRQQRVTAAWAWLAGRYRGKAAGRQARRQTAGTAGQRGKTTTCRPYLSPPPRRPGTCAMCAACSRCRRPARARACPPPLHPPSNPHPHTHTYTRTHAHAHHTKPSQPIHLHPPPHTHHRPHHTNLQ